MCYYLGGIMLKCKYLCYDAEGEHCSIGQGLGVHETCKLRFEDGKCSSYSPNTNNRLVYKGSDGKLKRNCNRCKHHYMCTQLDCLEVMMERVCELEDEKN